MAGQIDQPTDDFSDQFAQASANAWNQIENPQIASTINPGDLITTIPTLNFDTGAEQNNIAVANNIVSSSASAGNGPVFISNSSVSLDAVAPSLSKMQIALNPAAVLRQNLI